MGSDYLLSASGLRGLYFSIGKTGDFEGSKVKALTAFPKERYFFGRVMAVTGEWQRASGT